MKGFSQPIIQEVDNAQEQSEDSYNLDQTSLSSVSGQDIENGTKKVKFDNGIKVKDEGRLPRAVKQNSKNQLEDAVKQKIEEVKIEMDFS